MNLMSLMRLMRVQVPFEKNASSRGSAFDRGPPGFQAIPREPREPREAFGATGGATCARGKAIADVQTEHGQPDRHAPNIVIIALSVNAIFATMLSGSGMSAPDFFRSRLD
ncbi:MAG: hypothetical protein NTV97_35840 [Alphaproteobacteria bacterium]|nr:hypothetical protein [Alphaproteobacteria bacterium]